MPSGWKKIWRSDLAIDHSVRKLCRSPYEGRPRGCPNYNNKPDCPPQVPLIEDTINILNDIWLVWNQFPIGEHANRMWGKHPNWTERQAYCLLYWQGTARKQLREAVDRLMVEEIMFMTSPCGPSIVTLYCPEACGVNITETMRRAAGIELEWPPRKFAYQVALIGRAKG